MPFASWVMPGYRSNVTPLAVSASTVALWLFLRLRNDNTRRGRSLSAARSLYVAENCDTMPFSKWPGTWQAS